MSRRRVVAAALAVATVAAGWACRELEVDNRLERFLGDDVVARAAYDRFRGLFGSDEFVLVTLTGGDLLDPRLLDLQLDVVEAVEALPGVERVDSPAQVWRDRLGAEDPEALAEVLTATPFYRRLLVSDDARTFAILVTVDPPPEAGARQRLAAGLEAALAPLEAAGLETRMVGSTVLAASLDEVSRREARRVFPLAVVGSLATLALLLRSARATAVAATAAAAAVTLTLGLVAASGRPLNMVTTALAPLVWVLALSNVVHILRRYRVLAARGPAEAALENALAQTRHACTLAAATTAAGFASLLAAPLEPVRELGAFAAAGILLALAVNLTVAPVLVGWLRVGGDPRAGRGERRLWAHAALDHPRVVVGTVAVAVLAALASLPLLRVESNPLSFLPRDHSLSRDYAAVAGQLGGFYTLEVVVEPPAPWTEPAVMAVVDRLGERLAASEVVVRVVSPLDVLRELGRWEGGLDPSAYRLPADRDAAERRLALLDEHSRAALGALVAADGRSLRLSVMVADMDQGRFLALVDDARAAVAELGEPWRATVTGQVLELVTAQQRLVRTQLESLGVALVLVFVVLLPGLGSLRLTLLAAPPNLLPLLAAFATMAVAGIPLDPATTMVASIALGIAVDNTAHVLGTTRALERAGHPRGEAVALVLRRVGPAMLVGSATAAVGFASLLASDFVPLAHFGLVAVAAIAAATVGDLLLLPVLLAGRRTTLALAVVAVAGLAGATDLGSLEGRLQEAERRWDSDAAVAVLTEARSEGDRALALRVRAAAVAVGILRAEYEATPEGERQRRRTLGSQVDVYAEEALALVDRLPESAVRERLRADLLGAQIRSDLRARKLEPALTAAIARARELAPDDPATLTLAATPLLLAPEGRGRDLAEAERLLQLALDRDRDLERARLLLARLAEERGDDDDARAAYGAILDANPHCRPARARLAALARSPQAQGK